MSWIPLNSTSARPHLVKFVEKKASYEIYLTDLYKLFEEKVTSIQLTSKFKQLNPDLEMDSQSLLLNIGKNLPLATLNSSQEEDCLGLSFCTTLATVPFYWRFELKLALPDLLIEDLYTPLFRMVTTLRIQQDQLINLLLRKDEEILEYKSLGSKLSREHLETSKFIPSQFVKSNIVNKSLKDCLQSVFEDGKELFANSSCKNNIQTTSEEKKTDDLNEKKVNNSRPEKLKQGVPVKTVTISKVKKRKLKV